MKKRIFCLILALVMVLSLAACAGSGNDNTENTKDTTTNTEGSEATTPVSGGEAELALITDANSIDDRGFNQFSWEGLKQYAEENGKTYTYYTPIDQSTQSYLSAIEGAVNNGAKLSEAAQWLIRDAQASDCTWKILSVHQPAYYTNPNGGSDAYHNILPAAVDAAGIDAVFSGHDHSYARTQPMTGGEVDEKNGAVYFICGDLGEKSRQSDYAIVDDPAFHFARTSQDYSGLYLTVHATEDTMEITAHDCDGTVIDSTTLANGVTVKQVEDLIDAIGAVDENSKDAIDAARAAYDALPTRLQPEVSNYDKLVKAEKDYTDLLTAVGIALLNFVCLQLALFAINKCKIKKSRARTFPKSGRGAAEKENV